MPANIIAPVRRRTLWVDSSAGADAAAVPGDMSKPFATCEAAQEAAGAGDTIFVMAGNYTACNLGKEGVNWEMLTGATFSPGDGCALFSNAGESLSFEVTGNAEVTNGLAFNLEGSTGLVRARFRRVSAGVTVTASKLHLEVADAFSGEAIFFDGSDITMNCRTMERGSIIINNVSGEAMNVRITADTLNGVGVYQDIGGGRVAGRTDFFVRRLIGPDTTDGISKGYALLVDDGHFVAHNCEIRNGASNKLVGMDPGARLILKDCTILGTPETTYSVDRDGFTFNDVVRIVGRLTSNRPLEPGLEPYWGGQFVCEPEIEF